MPQQVNLIFQGGGVKGIAFVGALTALEKIADLEVVGVGGVSAGAIIAALYAAGYTPQEMKTELDRKPLSSLVRTPWTGYVGWVPRILKSNGVHATSELYKWLSELLDKKDIHTFADIRRCAEAQGRSCKTLKILTANVTDQTIDTISTADSGQEVASAVTKSISIPIYFRPYIDGHRLFVDGGLLSNYPLWLFQDSPLATVAFKLLSERPMRVNSGSWVVDYLAALVGTMLNAHDKARRGAPSSVQEVEIDASFVRATDFKMEETKRDLLFANGLAAVGLVKWNALPEVRSTIFDDPHAAQVLENTAGALAKLFARTAESSRNDRAYNFYHQSYFVHRDGSADAEFHFQIHNHGPGPISMLQVETASGAESNTSFLDLDLKVSCEPANTTETVVLPTRNDRIAKKFAVVMIPSIPVGESRELRIQFRAPKVAFRDLMDNKLDSVEVDIAHERGIVEASLTVQLESGKLLVDKEGGKDKATLRPLLGGQGYQWLFKDVKPSAWNFQVTLRRQP